MRILVVSNFYPPYYVGGYELGCRDVVEALRARGHEVRVLTSDHGVGAPQVDGRVYRWLEEMWEGVYPNRLRDVAALFRKERRNQGAFRRLVEMFRPELVYVWNPVRVSLSVATVARRLGLPVAFFISDDWMARLPGSDPWVRMWAERPRRQAARAAWSALRAVARALGLAVDEAGWAEPRAQFCSRFLMEHAVRAGRRLQEGRVVHWGIDPERFPCRAEQAEMPRRLLYAGQIGRQKGVHTAVEALHFLREEHGWHDATLDVVGGGRDAKYAEELRGLVRRWSLEDAVALRGPVDRATLASVYREHDVLVFPSVWEEPFSIGLLEGMASGLAVVGTPTGGSAEILERDRNALVFPAGDPRECARQIARLRSEPGLFSRVAQAGRATVEERFRLEGMVDAIEAALREALGGEQGGMEPTLAAAGPVLVRSGAS